MLKIKIKAFSMAHGLSLLAYITLLISLIYYVVNFSWTVSVKTFTFGAIVWSICSLIGIIFFVNRSECHNRLLSYAFFFLLYAAMLTILHFSGTKELASDLIYNFLWFSLLVIFYTETNNHGINQWYLYWMRVFLPALLACFIILVNTMKTATYVKTLNPVFYLLYLTPFVLLEKKLFRYIGLICIFIGIILSNKRTALLSFAIVIVYYIYMMLKEQNASTNDKSHSGLKLFGIVTLIVGLYIAYNYVMSKYLIIDWRTRLQNDADRVHRWAAFFTDMNSSNILQWIFGHGMVYPLYHNDFLQIMYDCGFVGLTMYVLFVLQLFKKWIQMSRMNYEYTLAFGASLIIFLADSMVGQVVVVHSWVLELGVIWGILLGDFNKYYKGLVCYE